MIDLQTEELLSLAKAAKLIPPARRGKKCHISTLLRWITSGAKTPSGETVRLDAVRLPRGWVTTIGALERFITALTPDMATERPPPPRSPAARQRASARAERELDKVGI